ncbi:MAG: hypothetical protein HC927_08635 [Deltaproteobacteria bacterium]|nr:hypothetical protein [Deltaproteobacteria bacterium]
MPAPHSRFVLGLTLSVLATACGSGPIAADDEIGTDTESTSETESSSSSESGSDSETDSGSDDSEGSGLPAAPTLQLSLAQVKQLDFTWTSADGAEHYRLLERVTPEDPYEQVGGDTVELALSLTVPLYERLDASYIVRACNDLGCTDSDAVDVTGTMVDAIGYFKASNTNPEDRFGVSVALSGDGSTLAVGAPGEDSAATGIDGEQTDDSASYSGAVYIFVRVGRGQWTQQAYVKGVVLRLIRRSRTPAGRMARRAASSLLSSDH